MGYTRDRVLARLRVYDPINYRLDAQVCSWDFPIGSSEKSVDPIEFYWTEVSLNSQDQKASLLRLKNVYLLHKFRDCTVIY